MRSSALRRFLLIAIGAVVAACSDAHSVTSPGTAVGSAATRQLLASPTAVYVVTRNIALDGPVTASAVIGALGGRIALPGTGLTVVVPALAVMTPTLITVTAVAGREGAYEFE